MQILSGINLPLADEHVLATDPVLAPDLPGVWLRRMRAFPGRAVSADALTAEQDARSGRTRLRGQSVSSGVVRGLGVRLEKGDAGQQGGAVTIAPGFGLARSGEDISIATPRRVAVADLPVYARADWLDTAAGKPGASTAPPSALDHQPGGAFASLSAALPRRMAARFGDLVGSAVNTLLPRVAVLVAEPVTAELAGRDDPADPCPRDPRNDPYDDWRRIDGCRLALYLWPSDILALPGTWVPDYSLPPAGPAARNQLAWRIFHVEAGFLPDEMHPWEALGVPLALLGFAPDWSPLFADRSAVVRIGGLPRPRTSPLNLRGTAFLWQAQLSQFAEHLADLGHLGVSAGTLSQAVRELPPAGLLPPSALDVAARSQSLFPAGFEVRAVPIAIEQLDLALRQSASLAPFTLSVPESVELLVPVPERVYEPGLLQTAIVDPLFARTVARFVSDRSIWLVRREIVRRRRDTLTAVLSGKTPSWRATDPDETDDERLATPTTRPPVSASRYRQVPAAAGALAVQFFSGATVPLTIAAADTLFAWVRIVPGAEPSGLGLAVAATGTPTDWSRSVYWGAAPPPFANDPAGQPRRAGDLPPAGVWTRLSRPASSAWTANAAALGGTSVVGAAFGQLGGTVEWGPFGRLDQAGNETVWIGDDLPEGAAAIEGGTPPGFAWLDADPVDEQPTEADFGTVRASDSRSSASLLDFRARWTEAFMADDFATLDEHGLDSFNTALAARLQVTNDLLDLGFTRARSDIYRVRQYVLGADAASRLVTSPTLNDISVRNESARAKTDQLSAFVAARYAANATSVAAGTAAVPPPPAGVAAAMAVQPRPSIASLPISRTLLTSTTLLTSNALLASSRPVAAFAFKPVASTVRVIDSGGFNDDLPVIRQRPVFVHPVAPSSPIETVKAPATPTTSDVQSQLPLPGYAERSTAVGERLTEPAATEAYRYALDGKNNVLVGLVRLIQAPTTPDPSGRTQRAGIGMADLSLAGLQIAPGVATAGRAVGTLGDFAAHAADYIDTDSLHVDAAKPASDVNLHESDYFSAAVAAIDNAIAMMRLAEGRVDLYQQLQADGVAVRAEIASRIDETDPRLQAIEAELAQARHDVATTSALLAEEQARIAALNARRAATLSHYVTYLAYRRPRMLDRETLAPITPVDTAVSEDPVVVCNRAHPSVPSQLTTMAGLFREAPIRWLPPIWRHLTQLDTMEAVSRVAQAVQRRLPIVIPFLQQTEATATVNGSTRYLLAAQATFSARRSALADTRAAVSGFDMAAFAGLPISNAREELLDLASAADLFDGWHGKVGLRQGAAAEVDQIAQVATCLYASFAEVLPAVRIGWAEALMDLTATVTMRSLAALPRWSELAAAMRREQQGLVDWLFGRVDLSHRDAAGIMSDLVRVAVLMACHAPVDQIVGAAVARATPARLGGYLDLTIDPAQVRTGMAVLVRDPSGGMLARGIIGDVGGGVARARISQIGDGVTTITTSARVHLTHALM